MVIPTGPCDGAARIGSGDLNQRIAIRTGDEFEALGNQFNSMAAQLQDSHATLEGKVEERTQQLKLANLAKSRFLAAASHDLRQPLHALGLFVAQLRSDMSVQERSRIVECINASVSAMNELFNALLDISSDAGALTPSTRCRLLSCCGNQREPLQSLRARRICRCAFCRAMPGSGVTLSFWSGSSSIWYQRATLPRKEVWVSPTAMVTTAHRGLGWG
jgi:signal transduction histidine kinase